MSRLEQIVTQSMRRRRRRLLTSCNEGSMLPPVWSVTHGSLIVAWRHSSTMSFIGWMCQRGLLTRLVSWCIAVFMVRHLGTSQTITTSSDVVSRLRLRSANRHQLIVPRCRLNTCGRRRAFSIAGPTIWNSLPDELRDPACGSDSFKQFLKTIRFSLY